MDDPTRQTSYFNYFTEIEEHYLRRRGTHLLLSTLDWALIETWKNAVVPLEAVLRGVDDAFDKYDQRPSKSKKVNSLAYCSQSVLAAAEDMKEAAVGTSDQKAQREPGFEAAQIAAFLRVNAEKLEKVKLPERAGFAPGALAREEAASLREMAAAIESGGKQASRAARTTCPSCPTPRQFSCSHFQRSDIVRSRS